MDSIEIAIRHAHPLHGEMRVACEVDQHVYDSLKMPDQALYLLQTVLHCEHMMREKERELKERQPALP